MLFPCWRGQQGSSLPCTFCLRAGIVPSQLGSLGAPRPRCGGRSKNREHRDPLWHRPQQGARTLCSQPCSSKEKADGDRCGGAPPPLARERQVSTGEETWGRRAAPTLRCGGRRPPPHPTPRSPLTRPAAGASAGKLGTPAPAPPQGSGTLLCSVPRGGGRRKKRHRGEVSRRSQRRRDRSCPPSGLGAGAPGHRGTLRPRPPRRGAQGATRASRGAEGGAGLGRGPAADRGHLRVLLREAVG